MKTVGDKRSPRTLLLAAAALLLAAGTVVAQPLISSRNELPRPGMGANTPDSEFHFARLAYSSGPSSYAWGRRGFERWMVDWPEAEYFLTQGINRLSRVEAGDGRIVSLSPDDDSLFDYPFLYAVEVGYWYLSDQDAARLREYLERGGFMMTDDFHGSRQWQSFYNQFRKVFPDRPIVEIPESDEIMNVLYNLDKSTQIGGVRAVYSGQTWEGDGRTPHWRGVYDDHGRLMVVINFNMDLGDAWEHADDPWYPEPLTALAYRFGVNYVLYAMTR